MLFPDANGVALKVRSNPGDCFRRTKGAFQFQPARRRKGTWGLVGGQAVTLSDWSLAIFVRKLMLEVASGAPKAHFNSSLRGGGRERGGWWAGEPQRPRSAKGAFQFQPGATPQDYPESRTKALKARFIISMPQSLSQVIIHIIFSTKNREPSIDPDLRPRLHACLATVARDNGSNVHRVGGIADHVHILATLSRTVTQAELLEEIKKHSSRWVKEIDPKHGAFAWQRGYGAISVGREELDDRVQYVETQEEHHRTVTFQEEYRNLLEKHGIEFDERYDWDRMQADETHLQRSGLLVQLHPGALPQAGIERRRWRPGKSWPNLRRRQLRRSYQPPGRRKGTWGLVGGRAATPQKHRQDDTRAEGPAQYFTNAPRITR